jgi:uncharacterized protein with PhoU and TrkA domain
MTKVLLIILLFLVSIALFGLYFAYNKLSRKHNKLKNEIDRINRDLAGICSAAVNVDTRLSDNGELLQGLLIEMASSKQKDAEPAPQPYQEIIQVVQKGVEPTELVRQFGVSFDEADLLIRLHGVEKIK